MIRLDRAVIVEGKYDKITLENVIDAVIIPTNGFGIFKDREKCAVIRELARRDGIIVMTDSDSAGQMIRSYLKNVCGRDGKITYVCVPAVRGREKRKKKAGREGLLGVEGMSPEILLESLRRSGVTAEPEEKRREAVGKGDLFALGLSGRDNSAVLRRELAKALRFPENLSANAFLDLVNAVYSREEFEKEVLKWRQGSDKK